MNANPLPSKNRDDIQEIKEAMIKHFADDEREFTAINNKLDNLITKLEYDNRNRKRFHNQIRNDIENLSNKVTPVVQWFDNATYSKRSIVFLVGLIGSIIAIAIGLRSLFHV